MRLAQTSLKQTGVAVAIRKTGEEFRVPLFSTNFFEEITSLCKLPCIHKITEVYKFEGLGSLNGDPVSSRTGIKYSNNDFTSASTCYLYN